jgi:hypothetical protein
MKIELRNIKYAAFASEETTCFEATVYVDGKKVGTACNAGHGGCNDYNMDKGTYERIAAYATTLPDRQFPASLGGGAYKMDVDAIIDDLVGDFLTRRDLQRNLGKRIMFTKPNTTGIFQTKALPKARLAEFLSKPRAELLAVLKADRVLNLEPFDVALDIYGRA